MSRYRGFPSAERTAIVAALLERDGSYCRLCDGDIDVAIVDDRHPAFVSIDHIKPLGAGGDVGAFNSIENLQLAHHVCNARRAVFGDHKPTWFARQLQRELAEWPKPSRRERNAASKKGATD